METIGILCRKYARLTSSDIGRLEDMAKLLFLSSDIAHARASLYVRHKETGQLIVVSESLPKTSYSQLEEARVGKSFSKTEEPLVELTFLSRKPQSGKRQWDIVKPENQLESWPICFGDSESVKAVLVFEWSISLKDQNFHQILSQTAFDFFTGTLRQDGDRLPSRLSTHDGILIFNGFGKVLWSNEAATQLYRTCGIGTLIGRWYYEKVLELKGFSRVMETLKPLEVSQNMGDGVWLFRYIPVVCDGVLKKIIVTVIDQTDILEKEKEIKLKETIIQEVHHRIKNNLQTVSGLLRLQGRRSQSPEVKRELEEANQRIYSISVVHEFLAYQLSGEIKLSELVRRLLSYRECVIKNNDENLHEIVLSADQAYSVALILNELFENALDHGNNKEITVLWGKLDQQIHIVVKNDVDGTNSILFEDDDQLGLKIVGNLSETLQGQFKIRQEGNEVISEIQFPQEVLNHG